MRDHEQDFAAARAACMADPYPSREDEAARIVAEIVSAKDALRVWDYIDLFASLPIEKLVPLRQQLKSALGKDFPVSDFKRRIRELRSEAARRFTNANGLSSSAGDDWQTRLLRNDAGKLISCYENAALLLEHSPEWASVLAYNEFTGGYVIRKQPPSPITAQIGQEIEDHFDTEVVRWLECKGVMAKPDMVRRVVDGWARRHPYHPIKEYLESLPPWDGVKRIGTWLVYYCGVDSSDQEPNIFAMAAGEKFLISAVARVMEPGCKVDTLLVLEGSQGIFKSMVPRILASDKYFSDQLGEMGSKDASMQLRGIWIMELSELDALNKVETSRAKSFFSQQTERFRLPYGHRVVEIKRQCVFVGTTNSDTWLKDETGGRRYWPVRCRSIDVDRLRQDRDQLWAEALQAYRAGSHWWLEDTETIKEAIEEQRGRYAEDVWQEKVMEIAVEQARIPEAGDDGISGPRGYAAIPEILGRLGIETAKQDQTAANRVARCLKAGGWERYQKRKTDRSREWRYRPLERSE